jgi:hypothetical protein
MSTNVYMSSARSKQGFQFFFNVYSMSSLCLPLKVEQAVDVGLDIEICLMSPLKMARSKGIDIETLVDIENPTSLFRSVRNFFLFLSLNYCHGFRKY